MGRPAARTWVAGRTSRATRSIHPWKEVRPNDQCSVWWLRRSQCQHRGLLFSRETGEVLTERLPTQKAAITRAVKRWRERLGDELHVCYEAGGDGFVLKRWLDALHVDC